VTENTATMAQADLRRVASAAAKLERVKTDLRMAIVRARESGETYRDIGEAAGLSHPRVIQIVREGAQLKLPMSSE
jgi:DNA-directed RNA polymerase specialized sigma24 family protein